MSSLLWNMNKQYICKSLFIKIVKELHPRILYAFKYLYEYTFALSTQSLIKINKRMKAMNYFLKKNDKYCIVKFSESWKIFFSPAAIVLEYFEKFSIFRALPLSLVSALKINLNASINKIKWGPDKHWLDFIVRKIIYASNILLNGIWRTKTT